MLKIPQSRLQQYMNHELPDGQYRNQIDYILCSQRCISSFSDTVRKKTRPGAHCGSDHEILTAKFRLKMKKVGKTISLFRYHLNQILSDNTLEVTNILQGSSSDIQSC